MPPLDWEKIMAADVASMEEDDIEDYYAILAKVKLKDETDAKRLVKLFSITQAIMNLKNDQVEDLMTELEEHAKKTGKSEGKREQELLDKIEELKDELKSVKKFGSSEGGGGGTARDSHYIREQLKEAEQAIDILRRENTELNRDLKDEKRASERYSARIVEVEKELTDLRHESDQMRQDVSDYKMQLQSQRDNLLMRKGEDVEVRDKMKNKNKELAGAMEELQNLTDVNDDLKRRCEDLQRNMEEAVKQMDDTAEDYIKLNMVLRQSDAVTDKLREDNEVLRSQVSDLNDQVQSKGESDDAIMVAVNNKIEEWKSIMADKEQEIMDYQGQVFNLREQLIAANMDSDKASVAALSKVIKEKDKQIEDLTEKLNMHIGDMDTNAAIIDDLRGELHKTGTGPGDRQQQRIRELQHAIKYLETQQKDSDQRVKTAEADAKEKDVELSEAMERMNKYEEKYDLTEAVAEIKEGKSQVKLRDRQIEEHIQHINQCELKLNDMHDENEDLRGRLGLDPKEPIDLTEFRKNKIIKREENKALNIILSKEVEKLEDERIELKQRVRKLVQQIGHRAGELGVPADEMVILKDYTENLKESHHSIGSMKRQMERDDYKLKHKEIHDDLKINEKQLDELEKENVGYKSKITQLESHNKQLEQGLKEVVESLKGYDKDGDKGSDLVLNCPTLDKMLAAIEAKNILGNYDTSFYLKDQVSFMSGRNAELREALREARHDANKARLQLDKMQMKAEKLEGDIQALQEAGAGGGMVHALQLPEGMAVTSSDIISSLNEHLVVVLQEMSLKEEMIIKTELALESYKRKFAVMRHQQGLLYDEYIRDKQDIQAETSKLQSQIVKLDDGKEEDKIRIQEFDRLINTLGTDDVEVRRRLADMTRKITVLRVNEKALSRRHATMEEVEGTLRKDIAKLRSDMNLMETAVAERMGYLQRFKDMAAFKMIHLQKKLDDSVPSTDLDKANKEFNNLTEKYRDLLERGNTLVAKTEAITAMEEEVKTFKADNDELKKMLSIEKEKLHTIEAAMEDLERRGVTGVPGGGEVDHVSISRKLTMLEMKELNERQRAEHAVRMYEQQRHLLANIEDRNKEIEDKFAEVTKMNLELQGTERDLTDELANSVTKSVSDADRKRILVLEESETMLKIEVSKLKEISEVACSQVSALESQQVSRDKEAKSLRQQLLDFQVQSDEKTVIGKLHRHLVQLQISEGMAVRKLEEGQKGRKKLEAHCLRLEQKLDQKDQTIFHNSEEAHNKARHLKQSLQELRRQFSGSVPLSRQEKFSKAMAQLHEDKNSMERELKQVKNTKIVTEDKLAEVELQHQSLQDLMVTLKDGRGAQKVVEWHGKMDTLRLEELKQKRQIGRLHQQIKYLEGIIRNHEVSISELEADNVRVTQEAEERQLRWEHREVELERNITSMEKHASAIAGAASRFEDATGGLPDSSMPVANQLEQAITAIKKNVKVILDTQSESQVIKVRMKEQEKDLRDLERALIGRDKLISEMRLRMPATADRDEFIVRATAKVTQSMKQQSSHSNYEGQQSLKIAQSTISSLQARIHQKEETILKYQQLLNQARDDMQDMNRRHEHELRAMQQKVHMNSDAAFSKFKEAARELMNRSTTQTVTNKQLTRLNELEDMLAEADNSMAVMTEKLKQKEVEISHLRARIQQTTRSLSIDKDKLSDEHRTELTKMEALSEDYVRQLDAQRKETSIKEEEIAILKEANARAPTTTIKNLVERLKHQVALKEKQQQSLSKALTELRADMVTQAQDTVKAHAEGHAAETNIQKVIDKHTKDLSDQIEDLQSQVQRLKKDLRKRKDSEASLKTELEDTKDELLRKETAIVKIRADKHKLVEEIEELESKVQRMSTMRGQRSGDDARQQELEESRRRIRLLEDELKRKRQQAEKPFEMQKDKTEELSKWEENKKWQKTVEKMKAKIKEKEQEVEKLQKNNEMLKTQKDRIHKDKESLEVRMKVASRTSAMPPSGLKGKPNHDLESLRQDNYRLQEEVGTLQRQLLMNRDAAFREIQLRNQQLMEKIQQLETMLTHRVSSLEDTSAGSREYQVLFEKNQDLQRQMIKISEENIELRFECEQAQKDLPRLKERIEDLQKYTEALKMENAHLSGDMSSRSLSSTGSNIRRIGESGKSTRELEKTIALLKKVVERVQSENEALKKSPGIVALEQVQTLRRDNDGLKHQLDDLRQTMGATLSERYSSTQKGTAKMMADYDKLRKEHMKEVDKNEKLRIEVRNLEISKEHLHREKDETKTRLEIVEAKTQTHSTTDAKGWKSAVVTRMYEGKVKGIEMEVAKKSQQLAEMKTLLKDAAEREQLLLQERAELRKKVSILERFPTGAHMTDGNIIQDYQHARLKIDRLENEKMQLEQNLAVLRQQLGSEGYEQVSDDVLTRANNYDRVLGENVDFTVQLKSVSFERDKLQMEVDRLKQELENFGPDFFEEIEDLKFNYKEAMQRNVLYDDKLQQISQQFGIAINIPGL